MRTALATAHAPRPIHRADRRRTAATVPALAGRTADGDVYAVRTPTAQDQLELRGLARRLGEPVPEQPVVVAAVDGRIVAATSVRTGVVVFDPRDAGPEVRAALRARVRA